LLTGTKVQTLTPEELLQAEAMAAAFGFAGTQFTCFTGTKVQILKRLQVQKYKY
jgi:hypothetical protein